MQSGFNPQVVVISFFLAFISSYSGVCLSDLYRSSIQGHQTKFVSSIGLLFLTSLVIGGGAIWSMHFTGMASLRLYISSDVSIPLRYDIWTTILSLATCVLFVFIGLFISTRDRVFAKDKEEVVQMLISDAQAKSIQAAKSKNTILFLAMLKGLGPLVLGGIITGAGVCVMHYVGMMATVGNVMLSWNAPLVFVSVVIAVVASSAAFWILFRLLALYPRYEILRIISALVMAIAVCGMHYTGMAAATYAYSLPHRP